MYQMNTLEKIIKFHLKMTQVTDTDKNNITLNTLLTWGHQWEIG